MKAYTYIKKGVFALTDKPKPTILEPTDAIVRTTLSSICSSDLHIKHGSVPRAVLGITLGHEMVGIVEEIGPEVKNVKVGDRVTVNVETFCGECFFCQHGYVNNCTSPHGGWALGCRIDGGQTEYVRVPLATQGLNRIPDGVSDEQALFVGDVLATGFWAARISDISEDDTVLIIGAGPTGICTLLCAMLKRPKRIIVCEQSEERRTFVQQHYPDVLLTKPEECADFVAQNSDHGGATACWKWREATTRSALPGCVHVPMPSSRSWRSTTSPKCCPFPTCTAKTSLSRLAASTAATAKRFCVSSRKAKSTPRRSSPTASLLAKSTKPTACLKTRKMVSSKWLSIIETSKHEIHTPDVRFAPMPGVSLFRKGYTS